MKDGAPRWLRWAWQMIFHGVEVWDKETRVEVEGIKVPQSLHEAFEMQAEANRTAPKFYLDTWHSTREGALKCPVCKPKVLKGESKVREAPVQPPHLVTDVWGQNGYTTDADGIRSRAVKHVLNGVVPPGSEMKWHAASNTKQRLELWESYLRGVGSLFP